MNILFLSTENPYPPDHGHYLRTFNILKYVAKHHNVFFLGFIKKKEDIQYVEPIRRMCKSANVFIIPDDISKLSFFSSLLCNIFSPLPYIAQKYYQKSMKQKMKQILNENRIDIIHFDMLHLARYKDDFRNSIPSILTEHNVESLRVFRLLKNSRNSIFKIFMSLQYIKLKRFEKRACANFDICASVSDEDMRLLKEMSPSANFVVVPNGVDTSYFAPNGEHPVSNSLVWAGGMDNIYNEEAVDFFIDEIFSLIQGKISDVKFLAVGKSPTKKLLHLCEANENVKAVGYVDDVRDYINSASVYVAPIKSGGGTKLKVLNALSMAKPVVTTSIGAEGIEVKDNKHLVISDDPKSFAKKTVELLNNPERATKLGENGRKLMIEKYDWEIIGKKMLKVYDELIGSYIKEGDK